ncbi:hypothetical protein OO17_03310 [Rhodopseudomonas palustris]|uniref:HTH lysR-type domain-containing protein n=1 Tax=Rhodopseudomonas palustris TaxID=1076 RepID=A0A0D7F3J4_RHOPL|nr:hypothetical protein OO17_03310 [Rhodopseudomonas palustris]
MFDLRYLHYALLAAEQGSFRRAAALLGIHQTQVGRRIRALEDGLGADIFERSRKGCRLTAAGETFLRTASVGMDHVARAAQSVAAIANNQGGSLDVAMMATLSSQLAQDLFRGYLERYQKTNLRVHRGVGSEYIPRLVDGRLDVAIVVGEPTIAGIATLRLWEEHLMLAMPTTHALAEKQAVGWEDLVNETFILTATGAGPEVLAYLQRRSAEIGSRLNVVTHEVNREDLVHLVTMGFGVTLLGESTVDALVPGAVVRPLRDPVEKIPTSAMWARHNVNPALKKFLRLASNRASRSKG